MTKKLTALDEHRADAEKAHKAVAHLMEEIASMKAEQQRYYREEVKPLLSEGKLSMATGFRFIPGKPTGKWEHVKLAEMSKAILAKETLLAKAQRTRDYAEKAMVRLTATPAEQAAVMVVERAESMDVLGRATAAFLRSLGSSLRHG